MAALKFTGLLNRRILAGGHAGSECLYRLILAIQVKRDDVDGGERAGHLRSPNCFGEPLQSQMFHPVWEPCLSESSSPSKRSKQKECTVSSDRPYFRPTAIISLTAGS